jgi:hypothetical protein
MVAFGSRESSERKKIEWNAEALSEKLKQVQKTTRLRSPQAALFVERWIAVYGRLEATADVTASKRIWFTLSRRKRIRCERFSPGAVPRHC